MDILEYKILLLGYDATGKTCFLNRYIDNKFREDEQKTFGYPNYNKSLKLKNGN